MKRTIQRVTFITDAPHFGGAERYILAMADCAKACGMVPHVHWMPAAEGCADVFCQSRVGDLSVTAVPAIRTRTWGGIVRSFHKMLAGTQPDALIIDACGRPRFWLTCWLAYRAGVPSVWVHHMVDGRDDRRLKPTLFGGRVEGLGLWRLPQMMRHRLAACAASAVMTSNPADADRVVRSYGIRRHDIRVVPPGVDVGRFRFDSERRLAMRRHWGFREDEFLVGSAGRLVESKGMHVLIDAISQLRDSELPIVAVIAGEGPQRDALVQRARQLDIADAVRFVSIVGDMSGFYSALDAFALCSDTESFGLVLTEAMACERPVVATATAGARLQMAHGDNGLLLQQRSANDLADALRHLHSDPKKRQRLGLNGRRCVEEHFRIDLTWQRTLSILEQAMPTRHSSWIDPAQAVHPAMGEGL